MNKFWVFSKIAYEISNFLKYLDCPHHVWMFWAIKLLLRFIFEHCVVKAMTSLSNGLYSWALKSRVEEVDPDTQTLLKLLEIWVWGCPQATKCYIYKNLVKKSMYSEDWKVRAILFLEKNIVRCCHPIEKWIHMQFLGLFFPFNASWKCRKVLRHQWDGMLKNFWKGYILWVF